MDFRQGRLASRLTHPGRAEDWREPDEEEETEYDLAAANRDDRMTNYAAVKGAGREKLTPKTPGGHRDQAWGGALRKVADAGVLSGREDTNYGAETAPGRYVPVGFARYVAPTLDPYDYEFYRVAGWRVAIPRALPSQKVQGLLSRIFYYGPASAGYVRYKDTLVPALLGPGDRATLGESALGFEAYPLSA